MKKVFNWSEVHFFGSISYEIHILTHERFLTIDHSCKIFFWYLPNCTSTDLWCVVLYVTYSTTGQKSSASNDLHLDTDNLELRFLIVFGRIVYYTALHSNVCWVLDFLTSGCKISLISSKKLTQNSIWGSWRYVNSQNTAMSSIFLSHTDESFNTKYMTNSTLVSPVKMEYGWNFSISGLIWNSSMRSPCFFYYWICTFDQKLKFHPYSILIRDTRVEFVIYCVLKP